MINNKSVHYAENMHHRGDMILLPDLVKLKNVISKFKLKQTY